MGPKTSTRAPQEPPKSPQEIPRGPKEILIDLGKQNGTPKEATKGQRPKCFRVRSSWGALGGKDNPQSPQEAAQEPRRDPQDTLRTPLRTPQDIQNRPKIKRKPYQKHSKIILNHLKFRCGFQCLFADFRRQGEALKSNF